MKLRSSSQRIPGKYVECGLLRIELVTYDLSPARGTARPLCHHIIKVNVYLDDLHT